MDVNSFVIGYNKGKASAPAGGDVELNIHYSEDTPPEDTTKLWVKTNGAKGVRASGNVNLSNHEYTNTKIGTLPVSLYGHGCCAVGNRIYIIGGATGSNDNKCLLKTIYYYDIETGETHKISATLTNGVCDPACVAVGSKIYIFGGTNMISTSYAPSAEGYLNKYAYVLDTDTNKLSSLGNIMPRGCMRNVGIASFDGNIYLFGGEFSTFVSYQPPSKNASNDVYKYADGSILQTNAKLPASVASPTCFVRDGNAYITVSAAKIVRFDPTDESVYDDVNASLVPNACKAVVVDNYLYAFSQGVIFRENLDIWRRDTVENPTYDSAACTDGVLRGSKIYILGGRTSVSDSIRVIDITVYPEKYFAGYIAIDCTINSNRQFTIAKIGDIDIKMSKNRVYQADENGTFREIEAYIYRDGEWI